MASDHYPEPDGNGIDTALHMIPSYQECFAESARILKANGRLAPDENGLKTVFDHLGVTFESLLEVEETVPDFWGDKWEEHLEAESASDTLGF